jgi:hypothetical protein
MSTVGSLGGGAKDPRVPTTQLEYVDGSPLGRRCQRSGSAYHQRKKTSTVGHLGGSVGDPGAPTINTKNVDGGPSGRQCQRFGSAHHKHKKCQRRAPWKAVPEIQERPPSTQKISMVAPLGCGVGDPEHPPSTQKMSTAGPLGGAAGRIGRVHHQRKKMSMADPLGVLPVEPGVPTTQLKDVDGSPRAPLGV